MENHALVINSFPKTYAMTGWRVGFAYGHQPVIDQMVTVCNYAVACASSVSQRTTIAALDLIKEEKVRVAPGYPFGLPCDGCIRIACTIKREKLCEAMDRLDRFIAARSQSKSFI